MPNQWEHGGWRLWNGFFSVAWLFIAYVSVHDACLIVLNRELIVKVERNPVGQWLLSAGEGEIWYLLAAKGIGTILACSLLLLLFWQSSRLGLVVAACVAGLQLGLLLYLSIA